MDLRHAWLGRDPVVAAMSLFVVVGDAVGRGANVQGRKAPLPPRRK